MAKRNPKPVASRNANSSSEVRIDPVAEVLDNIKRIDQTASAADSGMDYEEVLRDCSAEVDFLEKHGIARYGRPPGSKTDDVVTVVATACKACGSTKRQPYFGRSEQAYGGVAADGKPFTHILRHRTRCSDCGRPRIDRTYHNWPDRDPDPSLLGNEPKPIDVDSAEPEEGARIIR